VLFLKDINLPKPDKYDTCALIAFLQQLLTFKGFYDEKLEFLGIEQDAHRCHHEPRHHGRPPRALAPASRANVRVAFMDYADARELGGVYSAYVTAALGGRAHRGRAVPLARRAAQKLAGTMVDIFVAVSARFSVDEHRHYLFTPRDLTGVGERPAAATR
jgi:dynein heavy chain 2